MNSLVKRFLGDSPGSIFRCYMAAVLLQFAVLSLADVHLVSDYDFIHDGSFWMGLFSAFGALSLLFRSSLAGWSAGAWATDAVSLITFGALSYDFLTRKPPIYAGGVLTVTSAIFLIGGLIYERRSA